MRGSEQPSLAYQYAYRTIRMDITNITREQRSQLIGKLELVVYAIQPETTISEEMAEIIIKTLLEAKETIKKYPLKINKI